MRHFTRGTLSLSIASLFSLTTTSALAQESSKSSNTTVAPQAAKKDAEPAKTQQVEIKAQTEVELGRKDAAAKTVISNAELTRYGDTNVAEAMKRVPGVTVVKGVMQLPGMGAGYTQVLVDGEPPRGININDIPMSTIERVEIYRLGSAEFSSQAMAGTINIVLKKVPRAAQQQLKLGLSHDVSTAPRIEWTSSDKKDNLSYSLSLSAAEYRFEFPNSVLTSEFDQRQRLVRQDLQSSADWSSAKQFFINPIIQYRGKDGLSIRSATSLFGNDADNRSEQTYEFLLGRNLPIQKIVSNNTSRSKGGNTSIKLSSPFFTDAKLDLTIGLNGNTSRDHGKEVNYANSTELAFIRNTAINNRSGGASSTLKVTAPSNAEHDIVGGWNLSTRTNNDRRIQSDVGPSYSTPFQSQEDTHSVVDNIAFFAQDEWKFRKESSAYFGLRWESVRVKSEGSNQTSVTNNSSVWSPIIQTLWQLNEENTDRVRLGVSRTYKAPPNFALTSPKFIVSNNSIDNPSFRGNPLLRPELAWSLQTSYEHNDKEEFSYSIKAVVRRITDIHRFQNSYFDNAWWQRIVNAGEGNSKVLSFETQFPLKRFINDAPNIDFSFYVGRTWSSVSYLPKPDNLLVPGKLSANFSLDYKAKDLPLTLGTSMRYQDSNPIRLNDARRNIGHSRVDMDAYSLWKFTPKTSLRFSIDNLLKRQSSFQNEYMTETNFILRDVRSKSYRNLRLNFEHSF